MTQNQKIIGYSLIVFSVVLFIVLAYIKTQLDTESSYLCEKFHENKLYMNQCPVHQANSAWNKISWMILIGFGIDFLIFGVGIYLAFFHKQMPKESKKEYKEIDLSKLNDDEKNIYEIIKNKDGSAYQSDLIKETNFSKVKMSRILDKMEAKDILERKRRGMTNIIILK